MPLRVLFVDDEEDLVSTVVERLELRGIEATGAVSGEQALTLVERQPFDVVLLDVRMPGLGGLEVIQRIKRTHPDLEVILLSGHGAREDVETGRRFGAFEYLQKPVDLEDVIATLHRAAARREHVHR
ncbi:MAG TPA: response regulator [Bryobacteraceae bacterium]|nr:response regulator [Bryobacteraceae bacterium]